MSDTMMANLVREVTEMGRILKIIAESLQTLAENSTTRNAHDGLYIGDDEE